MSPARILVAKCSFDSAAQRAFRERKQSQLADLQARVQSYEQGEIERNVALQQIAKRLKEENELLKKENTNLKDEVTRLKNDRANTDGSLSAGQHTRNNDSRSVKRLREASIGLPLTGVLGQSSESLSRKKYRADSGSPLPVTSPLATHFSHGVTYMSSPSSLASSPDSNSFSGRTYSPLPTNLTLAGPDRTTSAFLLQQPQASTASNAAVSSSSRGGSKPFDPLMSSSTFDFECGLCNENTPCVCREFAMHQTTLTVADISSGISGTVHDYTQAFPTQTSQSLGSATLKVEEMDYRHGHSPSVIEIPSAGEDESTNRPKSSSPTGTRSATASILDNLPAYQPAVPLRRNSSFVAPAASTIRQIHLPSPEPAPVQSSSSTRLPPSHPALTRRATTGSSLWPITSSTTTKTSERGLQAPTCSGDPSNCPACKDDDFGKAFCRALGDSVTPSKACETCPNPAACGKVSSSSSLTSCMGSNNVSTESTKIAGLRLRRPEHHRSFTSSAMSSSNLFVNNVSNGSTSISTLASPPPPPQPSSSIASRDGSETIPANEAWKRLKSHPAIHFADLSMLADVVARRTKCSGPVAVIHPAPGDATPERDTAGSPLPTDSQVKGNFIPTRRQATTGKDEGSILLTDPHAHYRAQEQQRAMIAPHSSITIDSSVPSSIGSGRARASPPSLVPQDELRECGRRRVREVDEAGVREALKILDAQFGRR